MLDPYLEKASLKRGKFSTGSNGKVRERWDGWDLEVCEDLTYLLEKPGFKEDENVIKVI